MRDRSIVKTSLGALVAMLLLMPARSVLASEGDVAGGPFGGTDIRNAYLPPIAGLFGALLNVPGYSLRYDGPIGLRQRGIQSVNVNYDVQLFALQYVYPFKVFGGTVATDAVFANVLVANFAADGIRQTFDGWADTFVDFIKWSRYLGRFGAVVPPGARNLPYGLTIQPTFSMIFPNGRYNPARFTSPGHNDTYYIPNFAASYLTGPNFLGQGTEFSARLFYDHALQNPTTHYYTGDILDTDFAITERQGRWQYGLSGNIANQENADELDQAPVQPLGKRFEDFELGPIVAYDIPKYGVSLKFKVRLPVVEHNALVSPQFLFGAAFVLFPERQ